MDENEDMWDILINNEDISIWYLVVSFFIQFQLTIFSPIF